MSSQNPKHACSAGPIAGRWSAILAKRKKRKEKRRRNKSQSHRNDTPQDSQRATNPQAASPTRKRNFPNSQPAANRNARIAAAPSNPRTTINKPHSPSGRSPPSHTPAHSEPQQTATPASPREQFPAARQYDRKPPPAVRPSSSAPANNLRIATMRPPSPQLDQLASRTSPPRIRAAVSLLQLLQSRGARLQTQLDALPRILAKQRDKQVRLDMHGAPANGVYVSARIVALEEMMAVVAEHWYDVLVLEYALRDVVDEESGTLDGYLGKVRAEFSALVRRYDERIWGIMVGAWPEAVEETVREMEG